jgi:hypothetical protein
MTHDASPKQQVAGGNSVVFFTPVDVHTCTFTAFEITYADAGITRKTAKQNTNQKSDFKNIIHYSNPIIT